MATTTYTGEDATLYVSGDDQSTYGLGDYSLTIDRGTVEQELVGKKGNKFLVGAQGIDGSFTATKLSDTGAGSIVGSLIDGNTVSVSGNAGTNSLHFHFKSAMITGFDLSLGDASTVTEGSIDYTLKYPWKVSSMTNLGAGGTLITDY